MPPEDGATVGGGHLVLVHNIPAGKKKVLQLCSRPWLLRLWVASLYGGHISEYRGHKNRATVKRFRT